MAPLCLGASILRISTPSSAYLTKLCPFLIFTCKGLQDLSQVALSSMRNMNNLIRGAAEAILSFFFQE